MEVLDPVSANPGFRVNNAAPLGQVLRGNGTNFVPAGLGSSDITNADFLETITGTANRTTATAGLNPVIDISAAYVGQASITTLGTIATGVWNATIIDETKGGTGQSAVAIGDLLYGSAANVWSRLPDVAIGSALISGGIGVAPAWGKIGLATHTAGVLAEASGGTGDTTYTSGQILIGNAALGLTKNTLTAGTNVTIVNGSGTITISAAGGSTPFADPGSTIGLTEIVGVTATAMRSDAAPALSQAIVPVWSGLHTFTSGSGTAHQLSTADGSGPGINMQKRGSTGGSTTAILSGSATGQINFLGWNGAAYARGSYITGLSIDNFSGTISGGAVSIFTTASGGNVDAERVRITLGLSVGQAVTIPTGVINTLTGYRINNAAALGNLLKGNATNFVPFGLGAALTVLRVNAGGTDLEWAAPSGSGVTSVTGTASRITSTGGVTPIINLDPAYVGQATITTLGTITAGTWTATVIDETRGGTGQVAVAIGDLLYGSAANVWSRLADVAAGNALLSGGVGVVPLWGKVGLTTHISGILAEANGGTGDITYTSGQLLIGNSALGLTKNTLTAGTNITIVNGSGTITINAAGGGAALADPGSVIGLVEIVGVAATAMRSDGAPALSQSITPIWSGLHTFTSGSGTAHQLSTADGSGPAINMQKRGSSGGGSSAAVAAGSAIGQMNFLGWNGAAYVRGSYISGLAAETFTGSANGGSIIFQTTTPGGTADAERVRITQGLSVGQAVTVSSGVINALTGYRINNAAVTSGHYLRGNGTNYVDSIIQVADLPVHVHAAADITSGIIALARLGLSGTPSTTTFLRGDNTWATPAGGTTFGNPTSLITLAAFNGSAVTAMRSDATPALSPGISPNWTGTHTFTVRPKIQVNSDNLNPALIFERGAGGVQWGIHGNNGFFYVRNITAAADRLEINTAATGNYLRGNGTMFVSAQLSASDLALGLVPTARLGGSTANSTTFLRGDQQWVVPPTGGGGSPGGSSGDVQFNNGGSFGGSSGLFFDFATNRLIVGNSVLDPIFGILAGGGGGSVITLTTQGQLGFFGHTATTKPILGGSRGGNAALTSVCSALSALGLCSDTTTA